MSTLLCQYRTPCNRLTGHTPFRLVYGQEAVVPIEYIVQSLRFVTLTEITDGDAIKQRLSQLIQMEEEPFIAGFHQIVEKQRQKVWHDFHINIKPFKVGGLVLLYENKIFKHTWKLKMHWAGPYLIAHITDVGAVKLQKLNGTCITSMVNGNILKPYYDRHDRPG